MYARVRENTNTHKAIRLAEWKICQSYRRLVCRIEKTDHSEFRSILFIF